MKETMIKILKEFVRAGIAAALAALGLSVSGCIYPIALGG